MKKHFLPSGIKILLLFAVSPILTFFMTGSHQKPIPVKTDTTYVRLADTTASEIIDKEEYIIGVTAGMMADWDFNAPGTSEIAKMYGIIINTYMALKSSSALVMESQDFDLKYLNADMRKLLWGDQDFTTKETLLSGWLSDVSGLVIKCDGELITPYFHQLSAGATRPGPYSYLACANTSLDLEHPNFLSVAEFTPEEFCNCITAKYPDCNIPKDDIKDFLQVISRDRAGYVTKIQIGELCMSGEEFADLLHLPSSSFTMTFPENNIKIVTKGIGHGYGISLNYAAHLAAGQQTHDMIVGFFYNNIEITHE